MPIEWVHARMFSDDRTFDRVVIPVNCEGVAGAGLALEMKRRFPLAHAEYVRLCDGFELRPGECRSLPRFFGEPRVILAATKGRWRKPSSLDWVCGVVMGLSSLCYVVDPAGHASIALPALGCGRGGLDWLDVKSVIVDWLGSTDARIAVYCGDEEKASE